MKPQIQQDPISSLLSEFGTRLNEIEEKQRLVRDRALLIGENLIETKEEFTNDSFEIKKQINQINADIKTLKQLMTRVINEIPNFARKSELQILENQAKMFQPLELARISDVKEIVEEELRKNKK